MTVLAKTKGSVLDYTIDLSADLSSDPVETIQSVNTSKVGDIAINSTTHTDTTVQLDLSGGSDGIHHITVNAVTSASRTFSNLLAVRVGD
jgi:hypothetical protein